MEKLRLPILFLLMTFMIAALDRVLNYYWHQIDHLLRSQLQLFVSEDSLFLTDRFAITLYFYIISSVFFSAFLLLCVLGRISLPSVRTILPSPMVILLLIVIFLHLNSRSANSDQLVYASISYTAIVIFILREHLLFGVQYYISKNTFVFWCTSVIGLGVFILSHELTLSFPRVFATTFMINLWIYSTRARSLWIAGLMHLAWNWVLPGSMAFLYALFLISFYLAFAPGHCPVVFRPVQRAVTENSILRMAWEPFRVVLASVHYMIDFIVSAPKRVLRWQE